MTDLPQGWRETTLKDAAEVVMGQSPPSSAYNEVGVGKPFFQGKAEFGDKHPTVKKWTTEGSKHAIAGDILMSVRAPVGPTNIANVDCVIGRGLAAIRAGSLTNQTYLLWVLRSIETDIAAKGVGTTFASISGGELRSTRLHLPPLAEQERIVEILEEQFSRLDSALASVKAVREKAKAFRRSLLHSAFSGELTGGTEGWREVRLGEVADVLDSKRKPVNSKERAGRAGSVPYYGATGQVGTIDTHLFDEELVLLGEDGAPFLDLAKPKAYLISGKSWVNNHAHVLRCREGVYTNTLLVQFLNDLNYLPYVNGTTRLKLTQGSMNEIPVTVPPLATQERIVSLLEEQFSRLDKALEVANQLEARIASERRSLLHSAFTGALTATWRQNND